MLRLPETDSSLVIRTGYSDEAAWADLRRQIEATNEDGFRAYVAYYDDPVLAGREVSELLDLINSGPFRTFFFIVDQKTILDSERPVLVVDAKHEPGRTFRVVPSEMWSVQNNLELANMDFDDFADNADSDGVFRGFK